MSRVHVVAGTLQVEEGATQCVIYDQARKEGQVTVPLIMLDRLIETLQGIHRGQVRTRRGE